MVPTVLLLCLPLQMELLGLQVLPLVVHAIIIQFLSMMSPMETVPLLQLDNQVEYSPHQMEHLGLLGLLAQHLISLESLMETVHF